MGNGAGSDSEGTGLETKHRAYARTSDVIRSWRDGPVNVREAFTASLPDRRPSSF